MNKILFVTEKIISGRALGNLLGREFSVQTEKYGAVLEIEDQGLIICDIENDPDASLAEVHRLRGLCSFKDIPILVAVSSQNAIIARKAASIGSNGMVAKPFTAESSIRTLSDALKPVGAKTKLNMKVVTPFIDGTVEVIEMMAKVKTVRKNMFLKTNYSMFGDVSGVMGITGDTEGVVAVTFHQDLAFTLISKMVGCGEEDLSVEDVNDGIGEIINMIAGSAKKKLGGTDYAFNISLPTIVMGQGHQIAHQRNVPVIVMVFDCEGKPFAVQLCVSSIDKENSDEELTEEKLPNQEMTEVSG